ERIATYWDALCDLSLESVSAACQHAVRYWRPTPQERFPVPLTLREYAKAYREHRLQEAAREAERLLPVWSSTPDEVGVAAIRNILHLLGDHMEMTHPVYQQPLTDDPAKRRAALLEQARLVIEQEQRKAKEHTNQEDLQ